MKWTKEEKELLEGYAWADDSETVEENIQHAHYMLYVEGNHPEFKERSLTACRNMMYKIFKDKRSETVA